MEKTQKTKDDQELLARNIQKQYQGLFSGHDAPPAYISARQVDEMKSRIAELEKRLAGNSTETNEAPKELGEKEARPTLSPEPRQDPKIEPIQPHSANLRAVITTTLTLIVSVLIIFFYFPALVSGHNNHEMSMPPAPANAGNHQTAMLSDAPLPHHHDPGLVVVSIVIAVLASYAALSLAGRVTAARGRTRTLWLIGGSVAMGGGIWSMHFTAMMAFSLSIPIAYDIPTVIVSLLAAILASGLALQIASGERLGWGRLLTGGLLMGAGVAAMHYIGMVAMRLQADIRYDPLLFSLSILIAVSASCVALWLSFRLRSESGIGGNLQKGGSAVVMGAAIAGLHYTAMAAAIFTPNDSLTVNYSLAVNITGLGTAAITVGTFMILGLTLLLSMVDQRLALQAEYLAETERQHGKNLEGLNLELEARIADLALASEIGQSIAQVRDIDSLLKEAVALIRDRFDLYYTQIYLTDSSGRVIVLRAGTGEIGERLLRKGHSLTIGSGSLNGRAVFEERPLIVADTRVDPYFLSNPLLPETRSEMVVPLIAGGKALGVLDMQSERPGALTEKNLPAFMVLAGQLAVAIQNAALFNEVQETRAALEMQIRRLTEKGWQEFLNAIERGQKIGFALDQSEVLPLVDEALEASPRENATIVPIHVTGVAVGSIQVAKETARPWTSDEIEILQSTASRLATHIESLRLLAQAERFRAEAEQATRRLTREGWDVYLQMRGEATQGYTFNLNQVQPAVEKDNGDTGTTLKQPLMVQDETIGALTVDIQADSEDSAEIVAAVAEQLSSHIENLRLSEQNEKRAHEMETVSEVSVTASTTLDPDQLLHSVVTFTKERFGLYHAQIYIADDSWKTLLLAVGAGEIGRKMVENQHAIDMDSEKSIVARAAREWNAVIVNDVQNDPSFLSNPLLPETRSEMAVPMIVGDKVLGVFDVQSNLPGAFTSDEAAIYTTLASQVGVSLQNARLYVAQGATLAQLRELDRLKSSFLANMSHELRTPLNSILGFSDVMLAEMDGPLTENMGTDLQLIQKNGQHLLNLINDVLDMAKIEAGKMNLSLEKFVVHEILDEVVSITSTLASEKNLALFIESDSDQTVELFADRQRIRQVMINLVSNAIKFTDVGKIRVRAFKQDNDSLLITVKDTGLGISPEYIETIFQEFAQVDTSTTRKTSGTGLGLPISRRLIEMQGGRLWAESSGIAGEGSTFFVELPLEAKISEPEKE